MAEIIKFPFNKEGFDLMKSHPFCDSWPVVYLIENKKEIYVGETVNVFNRSNQHYKGNEERKKLDRIHVLYDEEYNKSATLDIESSLIQYMSADGKFVLQNGNHGISNHSYYDRQKYQAKFENIWKQLMGIGLVKRELIEIKNDDLFKYSPYKSLTNDQIVVKEIIIGDIKNNTKNDQTFIIKGAPGTGKTILAVYIFKALKEIEETKDLKVGLVVPMTSLRKTIKQVFKNIKGLKSSMVIGPADVVNGEYDVLIVDESHRLKQRKNIANYQSFDNANKKLGLSKNGTELDWISKSSKIKILFYDKNQSVRPSDVNANDFKKLKAKEVELKSQVRVKGGEKYLKFINDIFDLQKISDSTFSDYDFKIYDDIHKMVFDIKTKNKEKGLCRLVSGYAWEWASKKIQIYMT